MKILFSPSESKTQDSTLKPFDKNSFIFKELFEKRCEVLRLYENFVKEASLSELEALFGIKDKKEIDSLKKDLFTQNTIQAILRYNGVAFEYLDFSSLNQKAQAFILENTLIFSNLFGVIRASDTLPYYKFKQGAKLRDFDMSSFHKQYFSQALDEYLKDELVVDLRAGFYEKFYTLKQKYLSFKFLKNGKVVSHFAKAYRGILLRNFALYGCKDEAALFDSLPKQLSICEIKEQKFKKEVILDIVEV